MEKIPKWAYGDLAKKMEPPESVKEKGWSAEDAPSAEVFNWWMHEMSENLADLKKWEMKRFLYQKDKIREAKGAAKSDYLNAISETARIHGYFRRLQQEINTRFESIINIMEEIHPKTPKSKFYHLHKSKRR